MKFTNNMELTAALFHKPYIKVEKHFFELCTKVLYTPSNSKVVACTREYGQADGEKIREMLGMPDETIREMALKMEFIEPADNGMFSLSFCYSQDRQFAALQLSKYMAFEYRPVTEIRFIENDVAEALLKVLLK